MKLASSEPLRIFCIFDLHGLLFEPIAEFVVNFAHDVGTGGGEVGVASGGLVDKNKRGFVADAEAMKELVFESGLFDKPGGVDFVAVFAAMDGVTFEFGGISLGATEVDVFEEGASARLFARVGELVGTNSTNDIADALGGEIGEGVVVDISFDRAVKWTRHLTLVEGEGNGNDKVATLLGGVEDGVAVREIESVVAEGGKSASNGVVDVDTV